MTRVLRLPRPNRTRECGLCITGIYETSRTQSVARAFHSRQSIGVSYQGEGVHNEAFQRKVRIRVRSGLPTADFSGLKPVFRTWLTASCQMLSKASFSTLRSGDSLFKAWHTKQTVCRVRQGRAVTFQFAETT